MPATNVIQLAPRHEGTDIAKFTADEAWKQLPETKRVVAVLRKRLVDEVMRLVEDGHSRQEACKLLVSATISGRAMEAIAATAKELAKGDKVCPSYKTIESWVPPYIKSGIVGLVPGGKGRSRIIYGWEDEAREMYQLPVQFHMSSVAFNLRAAGHASATNSRVIRYLNSLPAHVGVNCPKRLGKHYHQQNHTPHVIRDNTGIDVGLVWEGDGHCCDFYIAHPLTGNPWRPELTVWLDWRSHSIVGWWIGESENAYDTLSCLARTIDFHQHVPGAIHVDPGPGFKNKVIQGEITSLCEQMSIQFMSALPGNARGKGLVEGFFHHFEDRCGKRFETYCGTDRTDDLLSRLKTKVKRGEIKLPTYAQMVDEIKVYALSYNMNPQKSLGNRSPDDLWRELKQTAPAMSAKSLMSGKTIRVVRKHRIQFESRYYEAPELAAYSGGRTKVMVEFDWDDDDKVIIRDLDGRFICDAAKVYTRPGLTNSVIKDIKNRSTNGKIGRHEKHIEEIKLRSGMLITHDQVNEDLAEISPAVPAQQITQAEKETGIDFSTPEFEPVQTPSSDKDDWDPSDYI